MTCGRRSSPRSRPDLALLGGLESCADTVPDTVCGLLAVSRGSTYAQVVRLLRARDAGPLHRASD